MSEDEERDLSEKILDEGEIVLRHNSDSGSVGGNCVDCIYQYEGLYYLAFEGFEPDGPYESIVDAITSSDIGMINNATVSFDTILPVEELIPLLSPNYEETALPYEFKINDETWQVNKDNMITCVEP